RGCSLDTHTQESIVKEPGSPTSCLHHFTTPPLACQLRGGSPAGLAGVQGNAGRKMKYAPWVFTLYRSDRNTALTPRSCSSRSGGVCRANSSNPSSEPTSRTLAAPSQIGQDRTTFPSARLNARVANRPPLRKQGNNGRASNASHTAPATPCDDS